MADTVTTYWPISACHILLDCQCRVNTLNFTNLLMELFQGRVLEILLKTQSLFEGVILKLTWTNELMIVIEHFSKTLVKVFICLIGDLHCYVLYIKMTWWRLNLAIIHICWWVTLYTHVFIQDALWSYRHRCNVGRAVFYGFCFIYQWHYWFEMVMYLSLVSDLPLLNTLLSHHINAWQSDYQIKKQKTNERKVHPRLSLNHPHQ